jgi:hypothetical protein
LTRSLPNLDIYRSPSRADNISVFSAAEKPIKGVFPIMAFMPSASLAAGYQVRQTSDGNIVKEVIFWEKNGLLHGEF